MIFDHFQISNTDIGTGITPFVNPDDLKFFFEEVHRLTK